MTPKNWADASSTCYAEQSYPAIIDSWEESGHLKQMIADAPKGKVFGYFMSGAVHLGFKNTNSEGWENRYRFLI